ITGRSGRQDKPLCFLGCPGSWVILYGAGWRFRRWNFGRRSKYRCLLFIEFAPQIQIHKS
ncbi:hypothetical protein C8R45DRAFT_1077047, partial [Mycena sanguinolenta]